MKITLLGTGTSQGVPVIGCDCAVCRSEDTRDKRLRVAALVSDDTTTLVLDVGPDFRQQMLHHKVQQLDYVLLTHEHNDHTAGLDDLRSFNFRQGCDIPIFAQQRVIEDLKQRFAYCFSAKKYPGAPSFTCTAIDEKSQLLFGNIPTIPIAVMHGKLAILGYRFGDFTYLTDVKTLSDASLEKVRGSKILVLSALHFKSHHAHLNVEEALALIEKVAVEKTYLTHISHLMGKHSDVEKQLPPNVFLAYDGLSFQF